jgi:hypothetical protein
VEAPLDGIIEVESPLIDYRRQSEVSSKKRKSYLGVLPTDK